MDIHKELRQSYMGAAPHTLVMGMVWILSGFISLFFSTGFTILFFFVGAGIAFPAGEYLKKKLKVSYKINPDNRLPGLFMYLGATIPLSFPVIYMAMQHNINWFFPAFAILVGGHYMPFIWAYKMPSFGILGSLLIVNGILIAWKYPDDFSFAAFSTGIVLIIFAVIHYRLVNSEKG
jgi:hypothetical protein